MEVNIDLNKSIEQNAANYYDKAKKSKKKLAGAIKALDQAKNELSKFEKERGKIIIHIEKDLELKEKEKEKKEKRKSFWYDKFRWFFASNGMLVVGGRDATSNDILIKKYMENSDLVFHTEAPGSPFFLIKTEGKEVPPEVLEETATATATFSRAWKQGIGYTEVYWVLPPQVSKTPESGEYISKGAFMIRGKRNYFKPALKLSVGILEDGRLMAGPPES